MLTRSPPQAPTPATPHAGEQAEAASRTLLQLHGGARGWGAAWRAASFSLPCGCRRGDAVDGARPCLVIFPRRSAAGRRAAGHSACRTRLLALRRHRHIACACRRRGGRPCSGAFGGCWRCQHERRADAPEAASQGLSSAAPTAARHSTAAGRPGASVRHRRLPPLPHRPACFAGSAATTHTVAGPLTRRRGRNPLHVVTAVGCRRLQQPMQRVQGALEARAVSAVLRRCRGKVERANQLQRVLERATRVARQRQLLPVVQVDYPRELLRCVRDRPGLSQRRDGHWAWPVAGLRRMQPGLSQRRDKHWAQPAAGWTQGSARAQPAAG
eukprot:366537-Chlamydomonas_euryale.AAC.22